MGAFSRDWIGADGVERPASVQPLQLMLSALLEVEVATVEEIPDGAGHPDLCGMCEVRDPRRSVDRNPPSVAGRDLDFSGVNALAHVQVQLT